MKAILKFLLNTGAGKVIVQAIIHFVVGLAKKKIDKWDPYNKENVNAVLDLVCKEVCTDVEAGKVKVSEML